MLSRGVGGQSREGLFLPLTPYSFGRAILCLLYPLGSLMNGVHGVVMCNIVLIMYN